MKISIVIPVYNTSKYLKQCIESILNQTYKNLEIIIVNDGSKDSSLSIIKEFKNQDKRIIVVDKKNGGLSSARNAGIKIASGEYILNVDSDDWIEPKACEVLIKTAISNDADIVIGNIYLEYKNHQQKWSDLTQNISYKNFEYLDAFFIDNGKGSICNKLIKRSLYIDNEIFHPENISLGEDTSTLLRLVLKSKNIIKISNYIYHYRQNEFSMMHSKEKRIYEYLEAIEIIKSYYYFNKKEEKYNEIKNILKYKLFYKQLFLNGYLETKKTYKEEWKKLNDEIVNLQNSKFYQFLPKSEKILLNLYKSNKLLTSFLLIIYLKLIKKI